MTLAEAIAPSVRNPRTATSRTKGSGNLPSFADQADDATIARTAEALRAKGYTVHVVDDGDAARRVVLETLPEGAEVGQGASKTLEAIGVTHEIEESGRFDPVRKQTR